jgi:N-glycosidase YbiA
METKQKQEKEILFNSKSGESSFLSNFHPCTIEIDGAEYKSVEHYYQSKKPIKPELSKWIKDAPTASWSKKLARLLKESDIIPDWREKREEFMRKAVRAKFTQNAELKEKLLATGDSVLHEDNPEDLFWGMAGEDKLGKMLTALRSELKKEKQGFESSISKTSRS